MKKIFACFCALSLYSCNTEKYEYVIEGKVNASDYEGMSVYLTVFDTINFIYEKKDSAYIKDSTFQFSGIQSAPIAATLYLPAIDNVFFVLEAGKINVTLSTNAKPKIAGTELNDSLQAFLLSIDEKYTLQQALTDSFKVKKSPVNDSIIQKWLDVGDSIVDLKINFIKKNANNLLGETFILSYLPTFDREIQQDLLCIISTKLKETAEIQQVMEDFEIMQDLTGAYYRDAAVQTVNGKDVRIAEYVKRGKVVLIDFWASWRLPHYAEMPYLSALYDSCKDSLEIISISLDETNNDWKKAVEALNMPWPQLKDKKHAAGKIYKLNALPYNVLLNKRGYIVAQNLRGKKLVAKIMDLLEEN
ncbi:MAG: AhpC/TSA family protein [Bacteroidales bacterium]|jgi:thiol-disulfide isomerase/thioredoxin|nr:AhpC/TSA family protein [Bacteroidales bacterium]